MPTTIPGLLLFVVLLVPGFAYLLVWERRAPQRRPSAFRETGLVVFGSVLAELPVLLLFLIFGAIVPAGVPDLDRLFREGDRYAINHVASLALWGFGLLTMATALAGGAAWALTRSPHPSTQSAWWQLFVGRPQAIVAEYKVKPEMKVCCDLDNGVQIEGMLSWFNPLADDVSDRDLILVAPLRYTSGDEPSKEIPSHAVCLSARNIKALRVIYEFELDSVPEPDEEEPLSEVEEDEEDGSTICDVVEAGAGGGHLVGTGRPALNSESCVEVTTRLER